MKYKKQGYQFHVESRFGTSGSRYAVDNYIGKCKKHNRYGHNANYGNRGKYQRMIVGVNVGKKFRENKSKISSGATQISEIRIILFKVFITSSFCPAPIRLLTKAPAVVESADAGIISKIYILRPILVTANGRSPIRSMKIKNKNQVDMEMKN